GLDFDLPLAACFAVIAVSVWLNVALRLRFRVTQRLEPDRAAWLLAFDIAQLTVLLFLTGGLANPVPLLILGPGLTPPPPRVPPPTDGPPRRVRVAARAPPGVRPLPAARGGRRAAGAAVALRHGHVAIDSARHRVHRRLRLAGCRGGAPARRCAHCDRAGA